MKRAPHHHSHVTRGRKQPGGGGRRGRGPGARVSAGCHHPLAHRRGGGARADLFLGLGSGLSLARARQVRTVRPQAPQRGGRTEAAGQGGRGAPTWGGWVLLLGPLTQPVTEQSLVTRPLSPCQQGKSDMGGHLGPSPLHGEWREVCGGPYSGSTFSGVLGDSWGGGHAALTGGPSSWPLVGGAIFTSSPSEASPPP